MKKITIKTMALTNFKGIRSLTIDFNEKTTDIFGANGTGKTTIIDAFTWLLFGKDSTDRQSFEIKTLTDGNVAIPKIEHEVEALISIDGKDIRIKRTLREKWVTKRGSAESEFSGNETLYHWNDVPVNAGEFSDKIASVIDEKLFKLITSPAAFNYLKWQDQRQVLIGMVGEVSDESIAESDDDFKALLADLEDSGKTLLELETQTKASLRKAKDELKSIPTRIDEVERGKPEPVDTDALGAQLNDKIKERAELNEQISDELSANAAHNEKKKELQNRIYNLEREIAERERAHQRTADEQVQSALAGPKKLQFEINKLSEKLSTYKIEIETLDNKLGNKKSLVSQLDIEIVNLRNSWEQKNAEAFHMDDKDCACPTCGRDFDADKIEAKREELKTRFLELKNFDLQKINNKGVGLASEKKDVEAEIKALEERIAKGRDVIKENEDELNKLVASQSNNTSAPDYNEIYTVLRSGDAVIKSLSLEIENLRAEMNVQVSTDREDLKAKLSAVQSDIDRIKSLLTNDTLIRSADVRISQLKEQEQSLAQTIADFEKLQFTIERFIKAKMEALETTINSRFERVKFKLFETQINGGEVPTCKALINGVPFSDANTASKINAGIDIINSLCGYYNVSAPIFIDNRESVTDIIPTASQIINLIVSPQDNRLRIESSEKRQFELSL